MTRIDFYILGENSQRDINHMVCRLCEKALTQQMKVLIYTQSAEQAQQLDDLLWTYKDDSFIAHHNCFNKLELGENKKTSATAFHYPVQIGSEAIAQDPNNNPENEQFPQLLINLSCETPAFYQQFERIAEMVGKEGNAREIARNRYRFYREKGFSLNKYDL